MADFVSSAEILIYVKISALIYFIRKHMIVLFKYIYIFAPY